MLSSHSLFQNQARRNPVAVQADPPCTVQAIHSGREGKDGVCFTRCIEGQEPEIYEIWNFDEDGTREVHPFTRIQISDDFTGETFHTIFLMQKHVKFLSWYAYLSTEVFNGYMS